jgi:hypothetical protein
VGNRSSQEPATSSHFRTPDGTQNTEDGWWTDQQRELQDYLNFSPDRPPAESATILLPLGTSSDTSTPMDLYEDDGNATTDPISPDDMYRTERYLSSNRPDPYFGNEAHFSIFEDDAEQEYHNTPSNRNDSDQENRQPGSMPSTPPDEPTFRRSEGRRPLRGVTLDEFGIPMGYTSPSQSKVPLRLPLDSDHDLSSRISLSPRKHSRHQSEDVIENSKRQRTLHEDHQNDSAFFKDIVHGEFEGGESPVSQRTTLELFSRGSVLLPPPPPRSAHATSFAPSQRRRGASSTYNIDDVLGRCDEENFTQKLAESRNLKKHYQGAVEERSAHQGTMVGYVTQLGNIRSNVQVMSTELLDEVEDAVRVVPEEARRAHEQREILRRRVLGLEKIKKNFEDERQSEL